MNKIKKWVPKGFFYKKEKPEMVVFKLIFEHLHIGTLSFEKSNWQFKYTEEFKKQKELVPIMDFPDVNKTYESENLWPFFVSRIPSSATPYVKKKIETSKISKESLIEMLKTFGENTITSPFKLIFTPNKLLPS